MKRRATHLFIAISILVGQATAVRISDVRAQTTDGQDETLRIETLLIEVRAVVTDKKGQIVDDLKKEDFEILEDSRPRPIAFFSPKRVGEDLDARSDANRSGVADTRLIRPAGPTARSVVLFVDTLHLSISSLSQVKQSLKKFVKEQLTDQDLACLISTAGSIGLLQQFTRDRRILHDAIDKLSSWQPSESFFTPYLAARVAQGDSLAVNAAVAVLQAEEPVHAFSGGRDLELIVRTRANQVLAEASHRRKATLLTLKAAAERLAAMPGQRIITLLSDGFSMWGVGGDYDATDLQSAVSRAARSGVVIYSLDAKGLYTPMLFSASVAGMGPSPGLQGYLSSSERDLEGGMHALASDTGGGSFFNSNDLNGALKKVLDENRVYYQLAYYPPDNGKDRKFRRITVRVRNHPEYKVRAQKGYLPSEVGKDSEQPARTPHQRLFQAIAAPLPATSIGVVARAYFLELDADNAQVSLQVYIDGSRLDYTAQGEQRQLKLELATVTFDRSGKPVNTEINTIQGSLLPDRLEQLKRYGYLQVKRLELKPGLYQIRVGVRDPGTENLGTATAWVEVPDLKRGKLTISNIHLAERSRGSQQSTRGSNGEGNLPASFRQGINVYKRGNTLVYQVVAYNIPVVSDDGLHIQIEILRDGHAVYQGPWKPSAPWTVGQDIKGKRLAGMIELNLEPGVYELRVKVRVLKTKQTANGSVVFEVEP